MQPTMQWLPRPSDFRASMKAAAALSGPERQEALIGLARHQLDLIETIQVDNALRKATAEDAGSLVPLRIGFVASSTIDHLLPAIRVAGLRRRLLLNVHKGQFGQYRQELLDPGSTLHRFRPQIIVLSLTARDVLGAVPLSAAAEDVERTLSQSVEGLRELWRKAREHSDATLIQQTFLDTSHPVFGGFDRQVPGAPLRLITQLNAAMADAAAADGVLLLDIGRACARDGLDAWFDVARWLQGKIEIAPNAAAKFGELLGRLIGAQRGLSSKCLVLDLDNTLWGGVIGDVGLEGIVLGEGTAAGEAHLALQRYAKLLTERGVILAVCSKNESSIAESAFREHPEMVLERSDIAAFAANWSDKAENLRWIAKELNIGLDSLVFVDDNPVERARVREALPMVAVPELPADPADYVRCVADAGYFEATTFTDEDRQRVGQYAANAQREGLRNSLQSMDDFLQGLQMSVRYGPVQPIDLGRTTQLINKTNQFNTTTRRFSAEEVAVIANSPGDIALQFRLTDRFGDNGLVSVMLLSGNEQDPQCIEIVNWVMSCRVFGRQLEDEAMNIAVEAARARGARRLEANLIATKKNAVISNLFPSLGFTLIDAAGHPGTSRWTLDLANYQHRPTFISRGANA